MNEDSLRAVHTAQRISAALLRRWPPAVLPCPAGRGRRRRSKTALMTPQCDGYVLP
jgi:hypothetical protein